MKITGVFKFIIAVLAGIVAGLFFLAYNHLNSSFPIHGKYEIKMDYDLFFGKRVDQLNSKIHGKGRYCQMLCMAYE